MTAPDLSPAKQAFLARPAVDAAEDARVDAAKAAVRDMPADWYCPADGSRQRIHCPECIAEVAAIAAVSGAAGETETALQRVQALADELSELGDLNLERADEHAAAGREVDEAYRLGRSISYTQVAARIRAALGGQP